ESSRHIHDGARASAAWIASLHMPTDDDLEDPVLDHGPQGPNEPVWTRTGSIEESGGQKIAIGESAHDEAPTQKDAPADARVLTIPPLPPAREAVLATGEINVDLHTVTGRPVWVTALLITALVLGVAFGVFLLRAHL